MNNFRIDTGIVRFGPGARLRLSPRQLRRRAHNLTEIARDADGIVVETLAAVEFKAGEVVGLPELPRHLTSSVTALDPAPAAAQPDMLSPAPADRPATASPRARFRR